MSETETLFALYNKVSCIKENFIISSVLKKTIESHLGYQKRKENNRAIVLTIICLACG